jgi:hypothetical protein
MVLETDVAARAQLHQSAERTFDAVTTMTTQAQADRRWDLAANERQARQFESMLTSVQDLMRHVVQVCFPCAAAPVFRALTR